MYDYETRGYVVEWTIGEKKYKQDGFDTEESAADFAREKLKTIADLANVIEERCAIGWW